MNELQVFNFEGKDIRTVNIENQPWFVGKDVADVLGYSNPQKALRDHIDNEDKTVNESFSVNGTKAILVNESGLYSLVLKSQLPGAKRFKRWVTSEILPSIRKHGAYMTEDVIAKTLSDPDYIIGLIKSIAEHKQEILAKNQVIGELKPKADYLDRILKSKSLLTITQIAKDYGMSGIAMNQKLHELGVQYKQSDQWFLYERYHDKGFTSSETFVVEDVNGLERVVMNTKWTMKGRVFLYNLLKEQGITPMIERT